MVTFVAADSQSSVAPQASSWVEIPPFVGLSTDKCTITKALDKAENDAWGEEGGSYERFTFKDTYNREKFNVAYYPEQDGQCDFGATAEHKVEASDTRNGKLYIRRSLTVLIHMCSAPSMYTPLTKYYDVSITNKAPYTIIDPYEANIFTMDCSTV
jgi:hypothetical protein